MSDLVYLVKGNDPLLRDRVVDEFVAELIADDDRTLARGLHRPDRCGRRQQRSIVVADVLDAASSPRS